MMQKKPKKQVEFVTNSGVVMWITPLSRYLHAGILRKAEELYPLPDEKDYEEDAPTAGAIKGVKLPASQNEEYRRLKVEQEGHIASYLNNAIDKLCVTFPKYADGKLIPDQFYTREELVEEFTSTRLEMAMVADLPEDEWEATWHYCILGSQQDEVYINGIVRDALPIVEEEVNDQLRLFRPIIQRNALKLLAGKSKTSGTA